MSYAQIFIAAPFIHNSKKLEATRSASTDEWINAVCVFKRQDMAQQRRMNW